jgi:hypothetical protein
MMVFNEEYIVSQHAIDQYRERILSDKSELEIKKHILDMVRAGVEIYHENNHKYIRFNDFIFPLVKMEDLDDTYKIKTILPWSLTERTIAYIERKKN